VLQIPIQSSTQSRSTPPRRAAKLKDGARREAVWGWGNGSGDEPEPRRIRTPPSTMGGAGTWTAGDGEPTIYLPQRRRPRWRSIYLLVRRRLFRFPLSNQTAVLIILYLYYLFIYLFSCYYMIYIYIYNSIY